MYYIMGYFEGIEVGFALSVLLLLERSSKPHCAIVGRVPHSTMYGGITTWPEAITTNGIIVFRVDGALYFGNCNYLKRAIQVLVERNRRFGKPVYWLMLDCHAMNDLDSSGVLALDSVSKYLQINQIVLVLTDLKYPVMKLLKRSHLVDLIGRDHFFHSVFHAHMYIYARIRLYKGLSLSNVPYDYIDEKGNNLINFEDVDVSALDKPLPDHERTMIRTWDPYEFHTSIHPLNQVKKGFELQHSLGRFSLAPKAEEISLKLTDGKPGDMSDETVQGA